MERRGHQIRSSRSAPHLQRQAGMEASLQLLERAGSRKRDPLPKRQRHRQLQEEHQKHENLRIRSRLRSAGCNRSDRFLRFEHFQFLVKLKVKKK